MTELDRGGWNLAYDVAGNADAPTALLLHDISDDRRVWRALATDMVEEFRTIAPDLRGLGESGAPPASASPPAMRDYAADLTALLDAEGVDGCAVIGAGFGAELALELALDAPRRVELIVLSGAVPIADHSSYDEALRASEGRRAEQGRLAGRFGMRRVAAKRRRGPLRRTPAHVRARALPWPRRGGLRGRARSPRRARRSPAAARRSHGACARGPPARTDPLLPAARLLAETLPNGRLVTLDGCGRGAPFVAPRAFEGALGAFLGDVRAAEARP